MKRSLVFVTGLSGAGKSTALHALEDLGFFCVDNLPTVLAPQAVDLCERGGMSMVALGIDVRVRAFLEEVAGAIETLSTDASREVHVLFLDASDETILRRFSETRRPHPLVLERDGAEASGGTALAVLDGVMLERERLAPLRARADRVIDTTRLSVHELRRAIVAHFGDTAAGTAARLRTRLVSFGFKFGAPVDADVLLDVRFLDNPYFVPELKALPGTDAKVSAWVLEKPETRAFLDKTRDLLEFLLPRYEREGKSYLTIALGCTGGRHRSVALVEALAADLRARGGTEVAVVHRDVARGERGGA